MENLNAEQVKSDLEKFTKSFECCHQGYVEACGLICKVRKEIIFDLANHRHSECNEDCKDYEPFPDLQAMRNALALINSQEQRIKELEQECKKWQGRLKIECEYTEKITVKKMHSMLCEGRVSNDNVVIVANQVAKEMLEVAQRPEVLNDQSSGLSDPEGDRAEARENETFTVNSRDV